MGIEDYQLEMFKMDPVLRYTKKQINKIRFTWFLLGALVMYFTLVSIGAYLGL